MILATTLFVGTLAQASIVNMKAYLPNGVWVGEISKNESCEIKAIWISDAELNIEAKSQYKKYLPQLTTILFSESKGAVLQRDELNETDDELALSQSSVLQQEEDYEVDFYEQVVLELVDGHKLESISVYTAEVDHESDPHEDTIICRNLTQIK